MGNSIKSKIKPQNDSNPSFAGVQQLLDSERTLIRYTTQIVSKFNKALVLQSSVDGRLVEFGAGTGFLAEIFRSEFNQSPLCVEIDPFLREVIKNKNFECTEKLEKPQEGWKAIYTSNVLEHIERDDLVLEDFFVALKQNGRLGVYVPAFQHLYSGMDVEINHVRRYSKKELIRKIERAGFTVLSVHYDDFLGYFASLTVKILGYKGKANLGTARSLEIYDKYVYTVSRVFDRLGFRFLIGKNLILIAQKIDKNSLEKEA
jgi:hypothetical protein